MKSIITSFLSLQYAYKHVYCSLCHDQAKELSPENGIYAYGIYPRLTGRNGAVYMVLPDQSITVHANKVSFSAVVHKVCVLKENNYIISIPERLLQELLQ